MGAPSNETEAEMLERRKVEALEAIAKALEKLASAVRVDEFSDECLIRVRQR